jgi:hypothetical protein
MSSTTSCAHADPLPPPSFSVWPQTELDQPISLSSLPRAPVDLEKPVVPHSAPFCALRPSSSTLTPPATLKAHEASRAPDTAPLPTDFEADVASPPSPVSRESAPPHTNWSHALTPLFTLVQLLRTPKITRAAPPPEHLRPEPTPPPHRLADASVHLRQSRLAQQLPLFLRELSPPVSPHLVARLDATGRTSPPPRACRAAPESAGPSGRWAALVWP